jgi:uncharacterized membrane protein
VLALLFGKVTNFLKPTAQAISAIIDREGRITFDLSYLIALLLVLVICFLLGLMAVSGIGKSFTRWIEEHILNPVPGYRLMKNASQAAAGLDTEQQFPVVLVPVDGWMIGLQINTLPNNEVVVFVPGSPNPWSGNVIIFNASDIRQTSLTQKEALSFLRQTGAGLKDLKTA